MPKTLTIRVDDATCRLIADAAAVENRSVSDFIVMAAKQKAIAAISVPGPEMVEIESDIVLLRRLRAGHRDAVARRGRSA